MSQQTRPFKKVLTANRGEIAIRIFRACTELGIKTVAIYSFEDRLSIHRYKADESFQIGTEGAPIQAYLDQDAIIKIALDRGADAIHPGYGFLSENADFAQKCADAGIKFIGPCPETLAIFGDKTSSRDLAESADVPIVPGTPGPVKDAEEVRAFAEKEGYPILLKAAFGGGGRGMRIVNGPDEIEEALARASSEALSAFGRGEMFCERLIRDAKHIEVQILADEHGNCVHLFERDCSIQRRHQKVVEIAPAVTLGDSLREELYQASLRIASRANYTNAGTVEFLVEGNRFYFIEVNPRIQVEHTVTEMITGRDLVQAQILIASGARLSSPEIGITSQSSISYQGVAIQCRITTEDPQGNFIPDTGKIRAYRSAAGFGIRLDTGTGGAGTIITSDYDTLIVKLTAWGNNFTQASAKALRSLREFRIRGVKTNIAFLERVVSHPSFLTGNTNTRFIDETPELMDFRPRLDRGTKLLRAIASATVNGPPSLNYRPEMPDPYFPPTIPTLPPGTPQIPPDGEVMATFREKGAEGLSRWLFDHPRLLITDTTFRDAHQSLLATRVRTDDLMVIAPASAHMASELFSVEMWGGATFDVAYRFLKENPWKRLERLREAMPNMLLQMLLRGANAVGYTNYPDNVIRRFVKESARAGIDVFRVFDALNWLPNMQLAMDEVGRAGKIIEACLCYTGDINDPKRSKYDLDYYLKLGQSLADAGAHILAIKDMAGLLKPRAAHRLVKALREEVGLPVHLHTHDTSGNGIAMYLAAASAGADVVDCALSSMSGLTSQPSLNALLAALEGDPRQPNLDSENLQELANYWERVRDLYHPFESGLKSSSSEVYKHEIPGGQYSNLRPRAIQLGLGHRWGEIKTRYREVNLALGDIVKVTPTSKVVADFAMFLVQNDLSVEDAIAASERLDFPQSLVDFFSGRLGQPYGGFPKVLQKAVLKGRPAFTKRAGASLADHDFEAATIRLNETLDIPTTDQELLSDALYPKVYKDFVDFNKIYGDVSIIPTTAFLHGLKIGEEIHVEIEEGKKLIVKLVAIGGLNEEGKRMVYFDFNGQPREVVVEDLSAESSVVQRRSADPKNPKEIGASMPGKVIQVLVEVGEEVKAGQTLLIVEAMKMETSITTSEAGTIIEILVAQGDKVSAKDLLIQLS